MAKIKYLIAFLLIFVIAININPVYAQETVRSNMVITKIGNPTTPPNISPPPALVGPAPTAANIDEAKRLLKERWGFNMIGGWNLPRLQLILNKFSEYEQTRPKFIHYITGRNIELIAGGTSNAYSNYPKVSEYPGDDNLFIAVLIHEFGHVIYHTRPDNESLQTAFINKHKESGNQAISNYSVGLITASNDVTENYAEMIAYCVAGRPIYSVIQAGVNTYREIGIKVAGGCN